MPVFPLNTNVSQVFVLFSSSTSPSNFIYSRYFTVCMLIIPKFIALVPPQPHCHALSWDFYTSETELSCSTRQFLTLIAYKLLSKSIKEFLWGNNVAKRVWPLRSERPGFKFWLLYLLVTYLRTNFFMYQVSSSSSVHINKIFCLTRMIW